MLKAISRQLLLRGGWISRLPHRPVGRGLRAAQRLLDRHLPCKGAGDGLPDLGADPLELGDADELPALIGARLRRLAVRVCLVDRLQHEARERCGLLIVRVFVGRFARAGRYSGPTPFSFGDKLDVFLSTLPR